MIAPGSRQISAATSDLLRAKVARTGATDLGPLFGSHRLSDEWTMLPVVGPWPAHGVRNMQ